MNNCNVSFSLDCELLWGISPGQPEYVKRFVSNSALNLKNITTSWKSSYPDLFLAFVAISTNEYRKHYNISRSEIMAKLKGRNYHVFIDSPYLNFGDTKLFRKKNIHLGLHGEYHDFHDNQSPGSIRAEVKRLISFTKHNQAYKSFYVYPKNLAPTDPQAQSELFKNFEFVRENPNISIYNNNAYNRFIRTARFLDSFFPILELLSFKERENSAFHQYSFSYYYRAQLPPPLLIFHVLRIYFFANILKMLNKPVHIWSHPHNFHKSFSIYLFLLLAKALK